MKKILTGACALMMLGMGFGASAGGPAGNGGCPANCLAAAAACNNAGGDSIYCGLARRCKLQYRDCAYELPRA